jgi:hypothetical protein
MIRILKLVTGEEIIGDSSEAHGEITVKKPCYIQLVPSRADPEQPAMALMPYAAYTKDHKVVIDISSVIWSEEPIVELYNQYNSLFGSGIVIPQNTM